MKTFLKIFLFLSVFGLAACAGSVKHTDTASHYQYHGEKFSSVTVTVSDAAKEKLSDNIKFSSDELGGMIKRRLETQGLIDPNAKQSMTIEITDVRIRSTFNAIMWGVMAGTDHIDGKITLMDTSRPVDSFEVSASYGLGGLGGGQDSTRINWLYEKFSELTVNELTGKSS